MKKQNQNKEDTRECEKCRETFNENELEIVNGDWVCKVCVEEYNLK